MQTTKNGKGHRKSSSWAPCPPQIQILSQAYRPPLSETNETLCLPVKSGPMKTHKRTSSWNDVLKTLPKLLWSKEIGVKKSTDKKDLGEECRSTFEDEDSPDCSTSVLSSAVELSEGLPSADALLSASTLQPSLVSSVSPLVPPPSPTNVVVSVPYAHACSVCLDLLYKPTMCRPCGHVFCEPCLKLLTRTTGGRMRVQCPMCRQYIHYTNANSVLEREIRMSDLVEYYEQRAEICRKEELAGINQGQLPGVGGFGWFYHLAYTFCNLLPGDPAERLYFWSLLSYITTVSSMFIPPLFTFLFFIMFVPAVYTSSKVVGYLIDTLPQVLVWKNVTKVNDLLTTMYMAGTGLGYDVIFPLFSILCLGIILYMKRFMRQF